MRIFLSISHEFIVDGFLSLRAAAAATAIAAAAAAAALLPTPCAPGN